MKAKRLVQVWRVTKKGNLRLKWRKVKVSKEVHYK